ncbi:hypothetical protein AD954_11830 [Acetobacter cerevisiae]|uniref:NmrA-like domain-containing protein n=1 Tax=Acetobacter cerevisiae TaxID=178900 RepID=A0A149V8N1_9PROT|nr:hypothetical protein AD954_11830 [Acetobacter cerevisiae]
MAAERGGGSDTECAGHISSGRLVSKSQTRLCAEPARPPVSEVGMYAVEGPEQYSPEDVAEVLGEVLNQPVRVASLPKAEWLATYRRNGFSDSAAQSYAHMTEIFVTQAYDVPAGPLKGTTDLKTYFQQVLAPNAA